MNLYKHHTGREVVAVLDQSAKLTYEAQCNLLRELKSRSLSVDTVVLEKQIAKKETAIQNLEHLKDLGFTCEKDNTTGSLILKRAAQAKVMDVVSILLGGALFIIGLIHFWLLLAVFFGNNEFSMTKLFTYVLFITAGLIGFKMLSGIHRFLDYNSFSLHQSGDMIRLRKGGLEGEQTMKVDQLVLEEEQEGELVFKAGDIEVMRSAEDNLVYKRTLEALLQKLITNR